tara:strand:+ start:2097 stop:2801 length:705 start_codon:yes stop_codon:yes gene_type:complete
MKKVAIVQSSYIPWLGYFDLIGSVDEFIIYDSMQFTKRDWRNRNMIKTPQGRQWLSVPVQSKGKYSQSIFDTKIDGEKWQIDHWKAITMNYAKAPFFNEISMLIEPFYKLHYSHLSELNKSLILEICNYLDIQTNILDSSAFELEGDKSEKLLNICIQSGANSYLSGPSAKEYLDLDIFKKNKIKVEWFNYNNYQPYPQLWGDFEGGVSILDLLFNCGSSSKNYLRNACKPKNY